MTRAQLIEEIEGLAALLASLTSPADAAAVLTEMADELRGLISVAN